MLKFLSSILITGSALFLISCGGTKLEPTCDGSQPTYDNEISPIIMATCSSTSSCHGSGASNLRGEITSYSEIFVLLENGKFQKRVLEKQTMPKGTTLTQEQINTIQCWVDNGYPEN